MRTKMKMTIEELEVKDIARFPGGWDAEIEVYFEFLPADRTCNFPGSACIEGMSIVCFNYVEGNHHERWIKADLDREHHSASLQLLAQIWRIVMDEREQEIIEQAREELASKYDEYRTPNF